MRTLNLKQVWTDKKAWANIRNKLPNMSDSKRSRIIDILFDDNDSAFNALKSKLKPEFNDTKSDKKLKLIMKEMLRGR